jgi:pyruvate/2-oxoglutarate dehydrogenase complex dihydrolipoamide dehydrogenase (E3) component
MAEELTPDICVIGAGPGGIAAAVAAAERGGSVVLVEKNRTGGNNLTTGTVPAKALVAAAALQESLRAGPSFGVTGAPIQVNLTRVREHIVSASDAIGRNCSPERLAALGVKVVPGMARFSGPDVVTVDTVTVRPRRVIIAAGSVPARPQIPGLEAVEAMTIADAFELARKPAHLIILGAGRYSLELAQAYARLGMDTSVIDQDQALLDDDPELATVVLDRLRAEGVRVRSGVKINEVTKRRGGVRVSINDLSQGEVNIDCSHILVATGRVPDVEGLGLAEAGIDWDAGGIVVDKSLRTTNRRVYAIGDAVAGPALAARAREEGAAVARSILYRIPFRRDGAAIPAVTFTDPGLASVGLSEAGARVRHKDTRVLRFPLAENDRAQIEHEPAGMIKVVTAGGSGRILGAAIVARDAGELIAPWSLAVANRLTLSVMQALVPPYPTRSEIARRAITGIDSGQASFGVPPSRLAAAWSRRLVDLFRRFG